MQMSLVSMRFIQFHAVLVQGRQKNVPKKNAIGAKFIVLLIKLSYCSCFDVSRCRRRPRCQSPLCSSMCVNFNFGNPNVFLV